MNDYRVELDIYHGPLDLLLYLIKRDEVDIHDIPIAHITEQYMQYLHSLRELDINLAGEFLVMAATLMEIKSAMMMPLEAGEGEDALAGPAEDPTDPRYELVQQLLAYKRYKDAATQLEHRREDFTARFPRIPVPDEPDKERMPELDLEDVQLWDLVEAFGRLMEQVGDHGPVHEVVDDDTPVELHMTDLVDRLERDGSMTLQQVFEGRSRGQRVGLFLAMLELTRQRRLDIRQDRINGEIALSLRSAEEVRAIHAAEADAPDREKADPNQPDDYDWPDARSRERYAKRIDRRAKGQKVEEDAELEADIAELEAEEGNEEDFTTEDTE